MNRRRFVQAASGLFLAPAIVRAESIMRVKPIIRVAPEGWRFWQDIERTIPALIEGDPVASMQISEDQLMFAIQGDPDFMPALSFYNGEPCAYFDGKGRYFMF